MKTLTNLPIEQIRKIVLDAANIIFETERQKQELDISSKGFGDYVTEIDLGIQNFIERKILQLFPEHQFFGEEGERKDFAEDRPCWILDPIDGTTNLIRGMKHSCISLAYWNGFDLAYGIVYDPFLDEFFEAQRGQGAILVEQAAEQSKQPDQPLRYQQLEAAQKKQLNKAITIFGTCPHDRGVVDHRKIFAVLTEVFMKTEDILRTGAAALDLAYVAAGRTDIFFEYKLRPWDFAAGLLLCEEAGAVVSDVSGAAIDVFCTGSILACNQDLQKQFLPLLKDLVE